MMGCNLSIKEKKSCKVESCRSPCKDETFAPTGMLTLPSHSININAVCAFSH